MFFDRDPGAAAGRTPSRTGNRRPPDGKQGRSARGFSRQQDTRFAARPKEREDRAGRV
jgi:hypothetical protein